jgi:cell division protease FtsH
MSENVTISASIGALAAIAALTIAFVALFAPQAPNDSQIIALNQLAHRIAQHEIKSIEVTDDRVLAVAQNGQHLSSQLDGHDSLLDTLRTFGDSPEDLAQVKYVVNNVPPVADWLGMAAKLLPTLFLGGIALLMLRPPQASNPQALSFGKNRARAWITHWPNVSFRDVAGVDEAKQELQEIVDFLKCPQRFAALGARIPHGLLLAGPPGTGKTLLARAVAGEARVPFFCISGSEFVEMFVGVGASRVRDLFDQAKTSSPCIIFVDEIDAVGRQRGAAPGGNGEREQTLNQILVEMDGFDSHTSVIVIAATNRPDVLDPALLRPGRFDRHVVVPVPDVKGRRAILEIHARGKPFATNVDFLALARLTPGFSGADLANLVNESALLAARSGRRSINTRDLEEAMDRVIAGPESRSRVMSNRDKQLTAFHESGHAVVMHYIPDHDPVHKITIRSRGRIGGYTRSLPVEDRAYTTESQFKADLASALGGFAAENVVFGQTSTGGEDDLKKATTIARKMVTHYGMSPQLGVMALGDSQQFSDKTVELIDQEVQRLVDDAYARALAIIIDHRDVLERAARALIQFETLEGDLLEQIFADEGPPGGSGLVLRTGTESPVRNVCKPVPRAQRAGAPALSAGR